MCEGISNGYIKVKVGYFTVSKVWMKDIAMPEIVITTVATFSLVQDNQSIELYKKNPLQSALCILMWNGPSPHGHQMCQQQIQTGHLEQFGEDKKRYSRQYSSETMNSWGSMHVQAQITVGNSPKPCSTSGAERDLSVQEISYFTMQRLVQSFLKYSCWLSTTGHLKSVLANYLKVKTGHYGMGRTCNACNYIYVYAHMHA